MKVLLDTHTFIWFVMDDSALSSQAVELIRNPDNEVLVSFHGNFGLNRSRMAGLLKNGLANPKLTDEELAKPFGYHAEFTKRCRS